uniref:Periplasmic protein n=1 Tax=Aliivibrio wodanis TaxID=80852 RepID=A0A5Q4ZUX5_9GAMM|nr:hypothetical protein AW0309160_03231 [Aliivibrio wodanis]
MKILLCTFALMMTFIANPSWASSYETVVTTGQGTSLDDAIDAGLRRAVEQVSGVSVNSNRTSATKYDSNGKNSEFNSSMDEGTKFHSKGDVKYEVLNQKCDHSICSVKLKVKVKVDPRDKIKDQNSNRRTIAIVAFSGTKGNVISQSVRDKLVQDRKFKVLNNARDPQLQYLVTGKILVAKTYKRVVDKSRTVELTGEEIKDVKTYYSSKVLLEYKIVDVVNNQIKWSDTIPTTSSRNNLSLLVDIASKKVFNQIKDNIYPLITIVSKDGSIMLNSGGKTVKTGEYYDLFRLGDKIIDPITKESLGYNETKIATVKVSRVLPKLSYVQVVKGDAYLIKSNFIARKSSYRTAVKRKVSKPSVKAIPKIEVEDDVGGIIL